MPTDLWLFSKGTMFDDVYRFSGYAVALHKKTFEIVRKICLLIQTLTSINLHNLSLVLLLEKLGQVCLVQTSGTFGAQFDSASTTAGSHSFGFSVIFSGQGQQDVEADFIAGLSLSLQQRDRFSGATGQVSCELGVLRSLQQLVGRVDRQLRGSTSRIFRI